MAKYYQALSSEKLEKLDQDKVFTYDEQRGLILEHYPKDAASFLDRYVYGPYFGTKLEVEIYALTRRIDALSNTINANERENSRMRQKIITNTEETLVAVEKRRKLEKELEALTES